MSEPVERVPGSTAITSPSTTASRRVDCTSTTGLSPLTMTVSVRLPTRISIGIVSVAEPRTSMFSRLTWLKPSSENVSVYVPGSRFTIDTHPRCR